MLNNIFFTLQYHVDDETVVSFLKPVRKTKKTGYQKRVRVGKKDKDCDNQGMPAI